MNLYKSHIRKLWDSNTSSEMPLLWPGKKFHVLDEKQLHLQRVFTGVLPARRRSTEGLPVVGTKPRRPIVSGKGVALCKRYESRFYSPGGIKSRQNINPSSLPTTHVYFCVYSYVFFCKYLYAYVYVFLCRYHFYTYMYSNKKCADCVVYYSVYVLCCL